MNVSENEKVVAVIPAGGVGSRLGGETPKQYLSVDGRTLLEHTVSRFESSVSITDIVVVVAEEMLGKVQKRLNWVSKLRAVVIGGSSRQDSVAAGVRAARMLSGSSNGLIVVHDAARPNVSQSLIEQCVEKGFEFGACIAALPAHDTIKMVDDGATINNTVPRETIWMAQTPQVFHLGLFERALKNASEKNIMGTDEASLVEAIDEKVHVVKGDAWNIKVTTIEDLPTIELLLRNYKLCNESGKK